MTRLGLVGLGSWGKRYVKTIASRSDCRIVAFAASAATGAESIPGAARCETWRALLDRALLGDLDAVIAATTPGNQAEIATAAVTEGVPLLVEKPIGSSQRDAEEVLRRFRGSVHQAPIVVDYVHLFAPAYRRLKDLVEASSGGVASVTAITTEGCNRGPFRSWSALLDYGPHDVAMCLDLLGHTAEFRLIDAKRVRSGSEGELIEARCELGAASVLMRVGNGASVKARRFAVMLAGGRTIVYDDCQSQPDKLVDDGTSMLVEETLPLDAALSYFLLQCRQWALDGIAAGDGGRSLALSVRVAEILDSVGRGLGESG